MPKDKPKGKPKQHHKTIIIVLIAVIIILAIFLIRIQKQKPHTLPIGSNEPCTNFNAGFKILDINYTNYQGQLKEKTVALWYPTNDPEAPYNYLRLKGSNAFDGKISSCTKFPLIIFSHGYSGCGVQSVFLTEELARHGYIVIAPDHEDALCSSMPRGKKLLEDFDLSIFNHPDNWTDKTFFDRKEDIKAVIGYSLEENSNKSSYLYNSIAPEKIGIIGHSLGGYTSLALIGGWPKWQDNRIKAALLLSPYSKPYFLNKNIKNITIPVMLQGGTLDSTITPSIPEIYAELNPPKFFLNIKYAGHMAWANIVCLTSPTISDCLQSNKRAGAIDFYGIAFFDKYLKNDPSADQRIKEKKDILEAYVYKFT